MNEVVLAGLTALLFGMLVNSVLRFLWKSRRGHRTSRLLAAASSLLTLLVMSALYSGELFRNGTKAIYWLTSERDIAIRVGNVLGRIDATATHLVNIVSPGADVGLRPTPSPVPAMIVGGVYLVRFFIYRFVERRRLDHSGATGSTYWSHFTAYSMLVVFLIEVAHWPVIPVIAGSLGLLVLLRIGLAKLFADAAILISSVLKSVVHIVAALGQAIARAAVGVATAVRSAFTHAHKWYVEHVSAPIRRFSEGMVSRSRNFSEGQGKRLQVQDDENRTLFSTDVQEQASGASATWQPPERL